MSELPSDFRDLFDRRSFVHVATTMPDGSPHVTPVWVDADANYEHVLINSTRDRRKIRNVERDPRVGLSVVDPRNPYRHVAIRGKAVEVTEDGAVDHIDALAQQYLGVDEYPHHDAESAPRVVVRIRPEAVSTMEMPAPSLRSILKSTVAQWLH